MSGKGGKLFRWAILSTVVLLVLPLPAAGQLNPPTSLVYTLGSLVLALQGSQPRLNETEGAAEHPCAALTTPAPAAVEPDFKIASMPFSGNWTVYEPLLLTVKFIAANPGTSRATTGFRASATLLANGSKVLDAVNPFTYAPGPGSEFKETHAFRFVPGANGTLAPTGGLFSVKVRMDPQSNQIQNIAIACDKGSQFDSVRILRGAWGDEDTDGDQIPDLADNDDDDDGFSDEQEGTIRCNLPPPRANPVFSKDKRLQPGDHDYDNDGDTDFEECIQGYDPLSAIDSIPPPPKFPWGLVILALIVLGLAAGLYFFVTTFGKAVAIAIVSTKELYIQAGEKGKYEVEARSLRNKGEPITYQLTLAGIPDGWDAKLEPDHVVLDNVGTGKERAAAFLWVEAPKREDPETAVVAVKAIPLNKAGRRDTTKLPARARTFTSINVPLGAKIPVKRGAPVKMKSEKQVKEEEEELAAQAESAAATAEEPKPAKTKKGKKEAPVEAAPAPPSPPTAKPHLQVGGLAHAPPTFKQGESVKSTVTVTNQGEQSQTIKLSLYVNDGLADAQTVTVKPGKAKDIKFKWTAQERNKLNIRGELVGG